MFNTDPERTIEEILVDIQPAMLSFWACGSLALGLCLHGRSFRRFVKQIMTVRRIAAIPHHCSTSTLSAASSGIRSVPFLWQAARFFQTGMPRV
jgi:hypothetical protein